MKTNSQSPRGDSHTQSAPDSFVESVLKKRGYGPADQARFLDEHAQLLGRLATSSAPVYFEEVTLELVHAWVGLNPPHSNRGLSRNQLARNKAQGTQAEKNIADILGGEVVPGSGSGPKRKGDVKAGGFLCQVKSTEKKGIRVEAEDLAKACADARAEGRDPAFAIAFESKMPVRTPSDWIAVPAEVFARFTRGREES